MTMETVLQIAAVCLVGAVLAAVLRQRSPEAALLLGLAVCAAAGALLLRGLADVLDMLEDLAAAGGLIDRRESVSARELAKEFSWDRLRKEDIRIRL